jgi:hypothetical protein
MAATKSRILSIVPHNSTSPESTILDLPPASVPQSKQQKTKKAAGSTQNKSIKEKSASKTTTAEAEMPAQPEVTAEKVKKIIPPHPDRTPEQAYVIAINHQYQKRRQEIATAIPSVLLEAVAKQAHSCTGVVSANIAINQWQGFLDNRLIARIYDRLKQPLLEHPTIIVPTWNVSIADLTVKEKIERLYEIGWSEANISQDRESRFLHIYLLARLFEIAIDTKAA